MGIYTTGVSALLTYQQAMNTTGHNIANVGTEGYSRQRVDQATQSPRLSGAGWIGTGVKITDVRRQYDDFIANQVRTSQSNAADTAAFHQQASRIDNILADPEIGLDPSLTDYFTALQTLSDDPTSVAARQLVLSEAGALVDRFHYLDGEFDDARTRLNKEIDANTNEINSLAESIAQINLNIIQATGASSGKMPNDLMDKREVLLNQLSQRIDISLLPQENGAINVFIGKGQALVMNADSAEIVTAPAKHDASLQDIYFQNSSGSQVITEQLSGGSIGGLLRFRHEVLEPAQNQLGLVVVGLTSEINAQHKLGLDLDGQPGAAMFSEASIGILKNQLNSGTGVVSATFGDVADLTSSDYLLTSLDGADQYQLERLSDGAIFNIDTGGTSPYVSTEIDGFQLTINAGADVSDKFIIQPTRSAASSINLELFSGRQLAAAAPLQAQEGVDANGNPVNTGTGQITQPSVQELAGLPLGLNMELTFSNDADGLGNPGFTILNGPSAPNNFVLFDPSDTSQRAGKEFPDSSNPTQFDALGGLSFKLIGTPDVGDKFTIANNSLGVGDNRNALNLAQLETAQGMLGGSASYHDVYSEMVTDVGAKTRHAGVNASAQEALVERNKNALASVSGVNLDEEAANLIKYQQMYQASAQMISVANTLFDTLLAAVRR